MKKYIPLLLLFITTGCYTYKRSYPISTERPVNNKDYKVDYLFEHEGCKVYRFYDHGNYVYFTNCNGEAIMKTDSTETRNIIRKIEN